MMLHAALVAAIGLQMPAALFEPNDQALEATEFPTGETFDVFDQTHDVLFMGDEDWLVLRPIPGFYFLSVSVTVVPPMGQHTLSLQLFDDSVATNPSAAPLAEFNPCGSATPGGFSDQLVSIDRPALHFFRIRDCFGVSGGEYLVEFQALKLDSPADPVRIQGEVLDADSMQPVQGMYVLSDTNASTFSNLDGSYLLLANAAIQNTLNIASLRYLADPVVVPAQPPGTAVNDVTITARLIDRIHFSGFEDVARRAAK